MKFDRRSLLAGALSFMLTAYLIAFSKTAYDDSKHYRNIVFNKNSLPDSANCSGLGIVGSTEKCKKILAALKNLRFANAHMISPPEVEKDQIFNFELIIDPSGQQTINQLQQIYPHKAIKMEYTKISGTMTAEADGEPFFDIKPKFPNGGLQVSPAEKTTFVWTAKAVKETTDSNETAKDPNIEVRLFARINVDGKDGPTQQVQVLHDFIKVNVSQRQRIQELIAFFEPIYKFLALIAGGLAAILAYLGIKNSPFRKKEGADECEPKNRGEG